jgi:ADP-heptose:LPS heptosyltransferase
MRILIIKRGALGDVLLTTPLIRQLRNNYKDAIIDYCVAKSFSSPLINNPFLNNLITLNDDSFSGIGILSYLKFVFTNFKKYDYIFLLGKDWKFNLLNIFFCGIKVGYVRESISKILLNKYVVYNDVKRYHVFYYLDLLTASKLAVADYTDYHMNLTISKADKDVVTNYLQQICCNNFVVVVNSGGNNYYENSKIRMLPNSKILELFDKLITTNRKILLLGGNSDIDIYQMYQQHNSEYIINCAAHFSLAQSVYLISIAQHFYTTDCGAMHLGVIANIGRKMTIFFGPTCPDHVLPPNNQYQVIWQDQDIFDKNYPLRGILKLTNNTPKFFTKLNINKLDFN